MFGNSIAKFFKLDSLVEHLTGYVETKVELVKVEVREQVAAGLAKTLTYLLIAFVFALVIFFISLGVAIVLADQLGAFWGYGIVALFYLIIGVILVASRKSVISKMEKGLSENFNKKK